MYLSKLELNPRHRRAQREAADVYQLHRTVMSGFPPRLPEDERVLFRMEADPRTGALTVLVQSRSRPDWSGLEAERARGYLLENGKENPAVKDFEPQFSPGQHLFFRLAANPTVKRQGKRLGLYKEEDQLAWLRRKAEEGGFVLLGVRTRSLPPALGIRTQEERRDRVKIHVAQFDGLLEVIDPGRFGEALRQGIGSGKSFGCGLLSVARAA